MTRSALLTVWVRIEPHGRRVHAGRLNNPAQKPPPKKFTDAWESLGDAAARVIDNLVLRMGAEARWLPPEDTGSTFNSDEDLYHAY